MDDRKFRYETYRPFLFQANWWQWLNSVDSSSETFYHQNHFPLDKYVWEQFLFSTSSFKNGHIHPRSFLPCISFGLPPETSVSHLLKIYFSSSHFYFFLFFLYHSFPKFSWFLHSHIIILLISFSGCHQRQMSLTFWRCIFTVFHFHILMIVSANLIFS